MDPRNGIASSVGCSNGTSDQLNVMCSAANEAMQKLARVKLLQLHIFIQVILAKDAS